MRLNEKALNVERSGDFKEREFRIKASRKAFDILSSQIYSDVTLAIVRELSTNAWDAHVEAGNTEKAFNVHLPNSMEPHFSIRDFGTGLSQEDVETLYTTYFESNKTHSNDFTGCLGIGSKSPFAYTDNFTVISYFGGKKYTYSAFRGEAGFPKVALMGTTDSDEPNGLEIIIAVKRDDFKKFEEKARKIYAFFPVHPNVSGIANFNAARPEIQYEGSCWKMYPTSGARFEECFAVMGNIGYPIKKKSELKLTEWESNILECGIDIQFDIGDLEMAASREDLQYTPETISAIKDKLQIVKTELLAEVSKQLEDCKTLWDARIFGLKAFGRYNSTLGHFRRLFNGGKNLKYKNQSIDWRIHLGNIPQFENYITTSIDSFYLEDSRRGTICRREQSIGSIDVNDNIRFVISDLERGTISRTREWIRKQQSENGDEFKVLLLNRQQTSPNSKNTHEENEKIFFDYLGVDTKSELVMMASSLPPVKRKNYGGPSKKSSKIQVHTFNGRRVSDSNCSLCWDEKEIDPKFEAGVYVSLKRFKLIEHKNQDSYSWKNPSIVIEILKLLKSLNKDPGKIYGLRIGYKDKIVTNSKNWIHLWDYAKDFLDDLIKTHKLNDSIKAHKEIALLKNRHFWQEISEHYSGKPNTEFSKIVENMKLKESSIKAVSNLKSVLDLGGYVGYDFKVDPNSFSAIEHTIYRKYPLLEYCRNSAYNSGPKLYKSAAEYMMLIDNQ